MSAPKKIIEEYFELKFIECGHRIRSAIPAQSSRAKIESKSGANFGSGSVTTAAPERARFPDARVVPVPGTCPACNVPKAVPRP